MNQSFGTTITPALDQQPKRRIVICLHWAFFVKLAPIVLLAQVALSCSMPEY